MFFSFRLTLHWLFFHIVRDFGKWSELRSRDTDGQTRESGRERVNVAASDYSAAAGCATALVANLEGKSFLKIFPYARCHIKNFRLIAIMRRGIE
jgi:hypothetical protein